jgi:hypothetical protein
MKSTNVIIADAAHSTVDTQSHLLSYTHICTHVWICVRSTKNDLFCSNGHLAVLYLCSDGCCEP